MSGITWLHLSDWHQKGKDFDRKVVRDALIRDIEDRTKISPDLARINFIIFSGDVAFNGKKEEYETVKQELIKPILKASGVKPSRLFIIPGNHDLNRKSFDTFQEGLLDFLNSYDRVKKWLEDEKDRAKTLEPFKEFTSFVADCSGQKTPDYANIRKITISGKKIAILGINSAWACGRHKDSSGKIDDRGYALIGEPQIYESVNEISSADLKIAVLHHPLEWLNVADRNRVERLLMKGCNFILQGHQHMPNVSVTRSLLGECTIIPAGACYERRTAIDPRYTNAYNFVHLDLDSKDGFVFLRRWSDSRRKWIEDIDSCDGGKFPLSIESRPDDRRKEGQPPFPIPRQIRRPPDDFKGREKEIDDLLASFDNGAMITGLRGMGGIGKTALALVLADRLKDRFPDGQFFVDMDGLSQTPLKPEDAMAHVIHSYYPGVRLPDERNGMRGLYQSVLAGKKALLLLDNAASREQVEPLLPPTGSAMLVTSRLNFTLPGLISRNLNELAPSDSRDLLLAISSRIGNQADELAKLCGYLPLALRAAGSLLANTPNLDPAQYIEELRDERTRLERLGSHGVDVDVNANFNLSYARLSPDTAHVFRMMSVFPADFDDIAEEIVCEDEGQKHLNELVRLSLVEFLDGSGRYRLHDLARVFASARLNEEDGENASESVRKRHAEHYKDVLSAADYLYMQGGDGILAGLKLLDLEWTNIQAGHAWAEGIVTQVNSSNLAKVDEIQRLALQLSCAYPDAGVYVMDLRLPPGDKISWLTTALIASQKLNDRASEGVHLGNLGLAYAALGDARKAIEFYEKRLVIAREIGDRRGEGNALFNMADELYKRGDAKKAIENARMALSIFEQIESPYVDMVRQTLAEWQKE